MIERADAPPFQARSPPARKRASFPICLLFVVLFAALPVLMMNRPCVVARGFSRGSLGLSPRVAGWRADFTQRKPTVGADGGQDEHRCNEAGSSPMGLRRADARAGVVHCQKPETPRAYS